MREQSTRMILVAACLMGIAVAAPTPPPKVQKHMSPPLGVLRLPQYQTACIVDVIQNNTDPETHIVSRDVEVLLTQCFAPPAPRCPEENPDCMTMESEELLEKKKEKTEEAGRADERPANQDALADILLSTSPAPGRAEDLPTTSEAPGRAETLPTTSAAPHNRKNHHRTTTVAAVTGESTTASVSHETTTASATEETTAAAVGETTTAGAVGETTTAAAAEETTTAGAAARSDEKLTEIAARAAEEPATAESAARADQDPTEASGRTGEAPSETEKASARLDEGTTEAPKVSARSAEGASGTPGRAVEEPKTPEVTIPAQSTTAGAHSGVDASETSTEA